MLGNVSLPPEIHSRNYMKISFNWLKEYLPVDHSAGQVAALLTDAGLEVENVETFDTVPGGYRGLVVGYVISCQKHPNADKLSVTSVDTGNGAPLQIVCGAPNVAAGQKVIVATVGTRLYPAGSEPIEIKKSKIRGELSEGMICAEDEIGRGASHAGIMILPDDARTGLALAEYFKVVTDSIFEIGLTPNRADAASHIGVARDLAAAILAQSDKEVPVKWPATATFHIDRESDSISVEVRNTIACPRYSSLVISGVKVASSPDWLQTRLTSIGLKPVNNIVDVTNFVLHECGQPLHAFDAGKISGHKVIVRNATEGEKFVSLDNAERILTADDLVICDAEKPMCIAGVFGGAGSGISGDTNTVFLESASFLPSSIRKTSKAHGLKTDASFRFERGTDPGLTLYALKRAALLIKEIAGGEITSGISDIYPVVVAAKEIELHYDYLDRFSGDIIARPAIKKIVKALGMEIASESPKGMVVRIPPFKVDVTRPVDIVEEILRIYGYNRIPLSGGIHFSMPEPAGFDHEKLQWNIGGYLCANGFHEILNNSLVASASASGKEDVVHLLNPLSKDLDIMRPNLLGNTLTTIAYNRNRKNPDLALFEFGKAYSVRPEGYSESCRLALAISGNRRPESWLEKPGQADFYLLKSFVKGILDKAGIQEKGIKSTETSDSSFAWGLNFSVNGKNLVNFGLVSRKLLKANDISSEIFYAEFDWDRLIKVAAKRPVQFREISRFPSVRRDLSLMIDSGVAFATIEEIIYRTEKKLLKEVNVFDVYSGDKIETGKKSYALSFTLQDDEQTLTDKQIDKVMDKLMQVLEKEAGAVIRKA